MLYKAGAEVRFLKFDATGTDNTNWFSQEQLDTSSWTDLKTFGASQHWRFKIYGNRLGKRSFEVSAPYFGCTTDGGWLVITSTSSDGCPWAKRNNVSSIIYSKKTNKTEFKSGKRMYFVYVI